MCRSLCGLILFLGLFSFSSFSQSSDMYVKKGDVLLYSPTADPVAVTAIDPESNLEYECLIMPGDSLQVTDFGPNYYWFMEIFRLKEGFRVILRKISGKEGSEEIYNFISAIPIYSPKVEIIVSEKGVPERHCYIDLDGDINEELLPFLSKID